MFTPLSGNKHRNHVPWPMKSPQLNRSRRAFARSGLHRLAALGAVAFVLFAAANAGLIWTNSHLNDAVRAHHSDAPTDLAVVRGNNSLFVSWRPEPAHTYELRWRIADEVNARWNLVEDPGRYRYEIKGLANGTEYDVQVRSVRAGAPPGSQTGRSDWSDAESEEPRAPVTGSNDPPTWISTEDSITVRENMIHAAAVAAFTAIGGDTNDVVNYELVSPILGPFAINADNGELYIYDELDFEETERYEITIKATDLADASIRHTLTINVEDVEGPAIPEIQQVCAGDGSAFLVWAQSSDLSYHIQWRQIDQITYSASTARNITDIDADRFVVQDLANGVDWVFRIRAVEKTTGEQSKWSAEYVVAPSVNVNRANAAPRFRLEEYRFNVREEYAPGLHVGSVSATDDDAYSQFTFTIGSTEPADAPFEIGIGDGAITTTTELDYENISSYTLNIVVRDLCGLTDEVRAVIAVINAIEVDVPPKTPEPPVIAVGHEQVAVLWDNFTDYLYDLDWRRVDERYELEPKDPSASSPRFVDIADQSVKYAFRLRTRNLLGKAGEWSEETIVSPMTESPTVLPVVSPPDGAVLGDVVPYMQSINLRKGQDVAVGVNLFDTDGALDNSLIDLEGVSIEWYSRTGEIEDSSARSTMYTAPHNVGDFAVRARITQTTVQGNVNFELAIPVRVIGEDQEIEIYTGGTPYPSEVSYRGNDYAVSTYNSGGRYEDARDVGASFSVPPSAIPVRDWIGVRLLAGAEADGLPFNIRRFDPVGNWYEANYVSSTPLLISGMRFAPHAEVCLPVPDALVTSLNEMEIMLLHDDGGQQLLNSPVRHQPDPPNSVPARVCAKASTFDGLLFLARPDTPEPTATPEPPTETPTPTPEPVTPSATPTPTNTPVPPPSPTPVIVAPTATPVPADTPAPEPTATPTETPTPLPTDTPTPVPTDTPTPEPTATATPTATPTPEPTDTPTPEPTATPTPTNTPEPTATPTSTPEPTRTPTSTATPQPTATPTPLPTDTPTPIPTATPVPPVEEDEESSSTGWIIGIVLLAFVAIAVAAGAMLYRARIATTESDGDEPPIEPEPEDDDDDDDDDGQQASAELDYETLTIDAPRSR